MYRLAATIKTPSSRADAIAGALRALGVEAIDAVTVPFEVFSAESRLNYDCVFPELWEEKQDAVYLRFSFPDSEEGRRAAYHVEFNLPQIPLNLRYDEI